jgi:hypothetical protein
MTENNSEVLRDPSVQLVEVLEIVEVTVVETVTVTKAEMIEEDPVLRDFENWVNQLANRKPEGCFFILNEALYPYFWGGFSGQEVGIPEAWDCICVSWLNNIYKTVIPLQKLMPFILKGYVKEGVIYMGNDCPYYVQEILFCFGLPEDTEVRIDPTLAINLNIPGEVAYVLRSMVKDCPYFETLPKRIQFRRKDYGSEGERKAAANQVIQQTQKLVTEKMKRARLGSLPKLAMA